MKIFPQPGDKGICENCPGQFKNKKVLGLTIMWDVRQSSSNEWSGGQILDAKSAKIYSVKFSLSADGRTLSVRDLLALVYSVVHNSGIDKI